MSVQVSVESLSKYSWNGCPSARGIPSTDHVVEQDLVASEEFELRPGESIALKLKLEEGSRYIGLLAAYRNLPETRWRHVIQIIPEQQNHAVFVLGESGIQRVDSPISAGNPT
ncbi:type VI secretion system lipoprotein TssJ, partial [Pseudomonas syringae pv. actinidiae]